MEIRQSQIKNFGKFTDKTIDFHSGINVIYGGNEMGKSTIHSFIRGMFFGIDKLRGRASKNDEYSLREPWENASYYTGTLRFESGGKLFRLERNFNKKEKSVQLVCESDGEELSVPQGDLEILMAGLNEAAFRNTVFFRQTGSATDEGLALELQNYMSNMQNAGEGEIDVSGAIGQLNEKRKQLMIRKKQENIEIQTHLQEVHMKLDYVTQEITNMNQERQEYSRQLNHAFEMQKDYGTKKNDRTEEKKTTGRNHIRQASLIWLMGLAVLLVCILIPYTWIKITALLLWMITFGLYLWKQKKPVQKTVNDQGAVQEEFQERALEQSIQKLRWNLERLEESLKEKQTDYNNMKEVIEEIQEKFSEPGVLDQELEAVNLAIHTIQDISDEIYKETARKLNQRISEILSYITDGQYTDIYLDANMEVRINTPEKLLSLEQVSRGTMEQIYFSLRMAVAELLTQKESMPIILDEAFAMYDDDRLRRTLEWLHASGHQVILFTCHRREEEILKELGKGE